MDAALFGLIILIGLSAYFLPTIVARIRTAKRTVAIFAVNLIFGWTVIGWITALIWAVGQQPSAVGEPANSYPLESDSWSFDPPKLNEPNAVDQVDRWVLGLENFFESPRNR
jgi:hypothetical protein